MSALGRKRVGYASLRLSPESPWVAEMRLRSVGQMSGCWSGLEKGRVNGPVLVDYVLKNNSDPVAWDI